VPRAPWPHARRRGAGRKSPHAGPQLQQSTSRAMARRAAPAAGLLSPRAGVTDDHLRGHAIPNPPSVFHRPHILCFFAAPKKTKLGAHVGPCGSMGFDGRSRCRSFDGRSRGALIESSKISNTLAARVPALLAPLAGRTRSRAENSARGAPELGHDREACGRRGAQTTLGRGQQVCSIFLKTR
jgi:hypothetical protein